MAVKVLLDANAYSLSMEGHPQVSKVVREAEEVILSAIVLGELLYGFRSALTSRRTWNDSRPSFKRLTRR